LLALNVKGVSILNITADARTSNPRRSNVKNYPDYNFADTRASDIDSIVLLLKGKEVQVSPDFMADIVALGTIMKGSDPAPHKTVDELVDDLLKYAAVSQDIFERTTQVMLGVAMAKVCVDYIERDMYTLAKTDNNKTALLIADYMFYEGDFIKDVPTPVFQKPASWPDFLIFYDPKVPKSGGSLYLGFILTQFSQILSHPPRVLVSPEDFDNVINLSPDNDLTDTEVKSLEAILTLMIDKRLFTKKTVPNTKKGGNPFTGWYFCRGCFQSYIEKSMSGCKGALCFDDKLNVVGKCGSHKGKPPY